MNIGMSKDEFIDLCREKIWSLLWHLPEPHPFTSDKLTLNLISYKEEEYAVTAFFEAAEDEQIYACEMDLDETLWIHRYDLGEVYRYDKELGVSDKEENNHDKRTESNGT